MKEKVLRFRMHERRYNKLKLSAEAKQKTMTQLIEEWIDRMPNPELGNSDARGLEDSYAIKHPAPSST